MVTSSATAVDTKANAVNQIAAKLRSMTISSRVRTAIMSHGRPFL